MKNKIIFTAALLFSLLLIAAGGTAAYVHFSASGEADEGEGFCIVTSFTPIYVICENLTDGIEDVTCQNLSEPQTGCLHDYTLTTADMKLLSQADIFVVSGGGMESFLEETAENFPDLLVVEATEGLPLLAEDTLSEEEEAYNAHAWMSVSLCRRMTENIASALETADPAHGSAYEKNAVVYDEKLLDLLMRQKEMAAQFCEPVILFHEAYAYLAADLYLPVADVLDLDGERQVSAKKTAGVLDLIRTGGVSLILAEETYGTDMGELIGRETEATVLYLDPLTSTDDGPDAYLDGMNKNLDILEAYFSDEEAPQDLP